MRIVHLSRSSQAAASSGAPGESGPGSPGAAGHDLAATAPAGPGCFTAPAEPTSWLSSRRALRQAKQLAKIDDLRSVAPSDAEAIRTALFEGERVTRDELGAELGSDWVLLAGYGNERGPIRHLLVGSHGVTAVESLYLNAIVHCHGDDWRMDRFDNYEDFIGHGPVVEPDGRSPSEELNEPADVLEDFLAASGEGVKVSRIVLLNHLRSRLGNCRRPTVQVVACTADLVHLLRKQPVSLDAGARQRIVRLVSGQAL
jgi:hypothetical protein